MTTADNIEITYCEKHPDRETGLRCNRCGKLICSSCAIKTPTGYRCEDCVRGQQKKFDTAEWYDYPLGIGTALILSAIGGVFVDLLGFFFLFIFILAPIVGGIIAEVVRRVIGRRRSKLLFRLITLAVLVGAFIPHTGLILIFFLGGGFQALIGLLWPLLYAAIATSTVYYRLAGIRLRL
ncbi:MAG: hypothetical protein DWQ07_24385 [Chloroflexi bacterium]|nr:MAG: hypothetical protein DWQ07_24385 [Chloroflexota bacterium]MBL1196272.1 hypothetical protein [Chloroflexota bacterium]NOH13567.1 hypothetical protein [Chloroflexota bacterium]